VNRIAGIDAIYLTGMANCRTTLLCIHRDPAQLSVLQDNGYDLVTATNGHDGLRLFMSQPVDAIVLEYHLGLLNGLVVAAEIKQVRPQVPIVLLIDQVELPDDALQSVDALVAKSDGPHYLWAAVHFVLNAKRRTSHRRKSKRSSGTVRASSPKDSFSPEVWSSILGGTVRI
jgi:DNA-binding response OmpR family regulator